VLSPADRASVVLDKVDFYLRAGVAIVWVIDPEARTLTEFRPGQAQQLYRSPDRVAADVVLPGFALDLATLFAEPAETSAP
jgi:Uma2 family endonuclease